MLCHLILSYFVTMALKHLQDDERKKFQSIRKKKRLKLMLNQGFFSSFFFVFLTKLEMLLIR